MEKDQSEQELLSAQEYFDLLKERTHKMTLAKLKELGENSLKLMQRFTVTGQAVAARKLLADVQAQEREAQLLEIGIDTFVYKDDVTKFLDLTENKDVKITSLENYVRVIPDEIIAKIEQTKEYFNRFFVVFTDYTGREEKRIEQEYRNRDPILFGSFIFKDEDGRTEDFVERMYFLGDWEDEYCDLTFDKFVEKFKAAEGYSPVHKIDIPQTYEDLVKMFQSRKQDDGSGKD